MRLSNAIRDDIVKASLKEAGFDTEEEALVGEYANFAEECRLHFIGGKEQEAKDLEAFEQLKTLYGKYDMYFCPPNERHITVNLGGPHVDLHYNGNLGKLRNSNIQKVLKLTPKTTGLDGSHGLCLKFHRLENKLADYCKRRNELRAKVEGVVNSVNSDRQLLKVWPEAEKLLPKSSQVGVSTQLPAIQISDINKAVFGG